MQYLSLTMNATYHIGQQPDDRASYEPIAEWGCPATDGAQEIGPIQPPVPPTHTAFKRTLSFSGNHQVRKIDFILMRGRVGTVIKAELAIIAFVDDSTMVVRRQLRHVPFIAVDAVE
jgi:hypothetical protein